MPKEEKGFKGVSLNAIVVHDVEHYIEKNQRYRSVAEFVSEAIRLRLEDLKKQAQVGS